MWRLLLPAFALSLGVASCATYRDDLLRGERYYKASEHEQALATWRILEADLDSLEPRDQARYAYLRGMTDYRLEYRADARHWLGIARELEQLYPGGLAGEDKQRIEEALNDLNDDYYKGKARAEKSRSSAEVSSEESPESPTP